MTHQKSLKWKFYFKMNDCNQIKMSLDQYDVQGMAEKDNTGILPKDWKRRKRKKTTYTMVTPYIVRKHGEGQH